MKKSQQGFTIIEIVVALVVLGILMGAAATQLNRFRATSYQTAANNIANSAQQAVNMKYASISQALSSNPGADCGTTLCTSAYTAAVTLLAGTNVAAICANTTSGAPGVAFTAPTTAPFAANANLGGGWSLTTAVAAGAGLAMTGPDTNSYTSEIPIMTAAQFCTTY